MIEDNRVKCIYCNQPIHISKFGGMNKKGLFCNNVLCLVQLIRENEEGKQKLEINSAHNSPNKDSIDAGTKAHEDRSGSIPEYVKSNSDNIHTEIKGLMEKDYPIKTKEEKQEDGI